MMNGLIRIFFCLFFLLINSNFVHFNDRLVDKIYSETKYFFIYVYDQPTLQIESIFMQFCHNSERSCAILDESIKDYDKLIQFIGYKSKEYFIVIDGPANKKYILQAKKVKTILQLENFEAEIYHGKWEAFYASQKPKNDKYMPCRSISGIQVKSFLEEPGMKVIYLYSNEKKCQVCGQMLRYYADTAENFYKRNVMSFGYINVHLNDHPLIRTKKTPSFLLFESASSFPEVFSAQEYEKLELRIEDLLEKHTGQFKSLTRHQYTKFLSDLQDI